MNQKLLQTYADIFMGPDCFYKQVGSFDLNEDVLYISDPCYDYENGPVGKFHEPVYAKVPNMKLGRYHAYAFYTDWWPAKGKVVALMVVYDTEEDLSDKGRSFGSYIRTDSEQLTIGAESFFKSQKESREKDAAFQEQCSQLTTAGDCAAVIEDSPCAVSRTGRGDGLFAIAVGETEDGKTGMVCVQFVVQK